MAAKSKRLLDTQTLETLDDIACGCRALRRCCGSMRMIHDTVGDPPLRRREAGFPGLARIVVGQQLSIASADAIWTRARSAIEPFEPEALLRCSDVELRTFGLSRPKIKTLRAIAAATLAGEICFETLSAAGEDELRQCLTAVPGVGPWSADIYLMFCRGARDAFAPSDLALQEATRLALSRKSRPHPNELLDIAERWRPWRGVAARLLWHYYAHQRALAKTNGGNNRRRASS